MNINHYKIGILFFIGMIVPFISTAQDDKPSISIAGEVIKPLILTIDDLSKYPPSEIKHKDKTGEQNVYTGVRLYDILDSSGVTLGSQLRGENLAKYICVKAADGYEVVFSLAEVDPAFSGQTILVAWKVDGKPLPKGEGPFRMIVPNDKRHARWIREIVSVKILSTKE